MEGEIRGIGPSAASAPRVVAPAQRRLDGEGGRDFGAELEERARHDEGGEEDQEWARGKNGRQERSKSRPRANRDDETGGSVDVIA